MEIRSIKQETRQLNCNENYAENKINYKSKIFRNQNAKLRKKRVKKFAAEKTGNKSKSV